MQRANIGDVELEFEIVGEGAPVLLIHGANVPREFAPMTRVAALARRCRLIRYHRRGLAGSSPVTLPTSIAEQSADALGLLDHLELADAHIVGHSLGGLIAIELASAAPDRARSLALLEPVLRDVPSGPEFFRLMAPIVQAYDEGRIEDAARGVFEFIGGPDWENLIVEPEAVDDAVEAAPTFFEFERPAIQEWAFDAERAKRVTCPVLSVVGTESGPFFEQGRRLLHSWFLHCVDADVVGATHFLESQDPEGVAAVLAKFISDVEAQRP